MCDPPPSGNGTTRAATLRRRRAGAAVYFRRDARWVPPGGCYPTSGHRSRAARTHRASHTSPAFLSPAASGLRSGRRRPPRPRLMPPLAVRGRLLCVGCALGPGRWHLGGLLRGGGLPRRRSALGRMSMTPCPMPGHALALLASRLACRRLLRLHGGRTLDISRDAVTLVAADEPASHGVLYQLPGILDAKRPDAGCRACKIHHRVSDGTPQHVCDAGNGLENTGDCSAAQLSWHCDLHAPQCVRKSSVPAWRRSSPRWPGASANLSSVQRFVKEIRHTHRRSPIP